jgi:spore germination protein GerM
MSPIPSVLLWFALAGADSPRENAMIFVTDRNSGFLRVQRLSLNAGLSSQERAKALLEGLLALPSAQGAPLPPGTRLNHLFLTQDGTAVLDLGPEALKCPSGASSEILAAQALVLTLTTNLPGITKVLIMVEGRKRETLAGHLGLLEALSPLEDLVKKEEGAL